MKYNKWIFAIIVCAINDFSYGNMYRELQGVYNTNPIIAGARSAVGSASAGIDLARGGYKPYLGITAGVGAAHSEIMGMDFDYNPAIVAGEIRQPVFAGGATVAGIKAARALYDSEIAVLYSTTQDVFLSAINAYINVLNTQRVLELNENNLRVLNEYFEFVSNRADVGILTQTDVASATARVAGAKYSVATARADYDNAIETYMRIFGNAPDDDMDEIDIDVVAHLFPDDVDTGLEYALASHPALRALNAQEIAARADITIARQTRMPAIDVRASAMQVEDTPILGRVRDGRVGVYLSVPLYDRGAAGARVERARFTIDGIGEQIQNARRTIRENLNMAWNIYNAQDAAITAGESRVAAAKLALTGIRDEQARGRRTVLDVLNAEQELLDARVSLARAKHAKTSAYFAVIAAIGKLTAENVGIDK